LFAPPAWPSIAPDDVFVRDADLPGTETDDFVELFQQLYPRLVRSLHLAGAPPALAEDLAQEAFARTLRHWRRVRGGESPAGYVYRVAFRELRREGLVPASPADSLEPTDPRGDDALTFTLTLADVERALAAMPPRRRACAVLCLLLDVSPTDAGEALKIAPATVRKQVELARRELRLAVMPY